MSSVAWQSLEPFGTIVKKTTTTIFKCEWGMSGVSIIQKLNANPSHEYLKTQIFNLARVIEYRDWGRTKTLMSLRQGVDCGSYTSASHLSPLLGRRLAGGHLERSPCIDRSSEACFSPAPLATATIKAAAPDMGLSSPSSRGHWLHSVQPCFSCYLLLIVDVIIIFVFPHCFFLF